jgi:hypothetical protein
MNIIGNALIFLAYINVLINQKVNAKQAVPTIGIQKCIQLCIHIKD